MMGAAHVLQYPTAILDSAIVRGLIDKQCELLRALELHPELSAFINLSVGEVEQTIAAHQLTLRYLRGTS